MKSLLQKIFENEFNDSNYRDLILNLFNSFDFSKEHSLKHQFNDAERQALNDFTYFGTYEDAEKKCLDVLTVELKSSSKVERARSLQRNLIGKYLKTNHKDSALVAFYSTDNPDWRLSFVKMDYRLDDKGAKVEIGTPPKRFSFLVGKTEPSHTAKKQLLPLLNDKVIPMVAEIERTFDIEVVTKEFYKDFVSIYLLLKEEIEKDMRFKNKADKEAQTILDRLLFLYFIQKKGWLNSNRNFLYESFKKSCENDNKDDYSFYKKVVFPLFHALSDEDYKSEVLGDIPFLNGGLFEITKNDFINQINLSVSNNVFNEIFNNLLKLYNFTVYEGTPIDIEVAIDPEMLGKIFENLILQREKNPEKDLRKATGSYYTPRINVHFMCQQALQEYITSEGIIEESKLNQIFTIAKDISVIMSGSKNLEGILTVKEASQLKDLILKAKIIDLAVGSGAFIVGMLHEMLSIMKLCDVRISGLNILDRANYDYELKRKIIEHCLYGVDIQEEAVRICELRLWLSLIVDYQIDSKKPFPLAIKEIPTLPNLSYRICHGDSLIEKLYGHNVQLDKLPPSDKGRQLIDQINAEKDAYFLAKDIKDKQKKELNILVKQAELAEFLIEEKRKSLISEAQSQTSLLEETAKEQKAREYYEILLKEYSEIKERSIANKIRLKEMLTGKRPIEMKDINSLRNKMGISFIWKLDFAEVFKEKEGFDIVIANPPYIRQEDIKELKPILQRQGYEVYNSTSDIYTYFYEKGYQVLKKNGIFCFISSNKFMRAKYGEKLRKFLQEKTLLKQIIDFGGHKVFESATVDTCIVIFEKQYPTEDKTNPPFSKGGLGGFSNEVRFVNISDDYQNSYDLAVYITEKGFCIPQSKLSPQHWTLADDRVLRLKEKIERFGTPLKKWDVKIYRGVITGFNEAFIIDNETKERLCKEAPKSAEVLKPILRGRDIERYSYKWAGLWLIKIESGWTNKKLLDSRLHGNDKKQRHSCESRNPENKAEASALKMFQDTYPAVYEHLKSMGERKGKGKGLYNRDDQGDYWWELRDCDYYEEFEKEKIVYPDIAERLSFAYEDGVVFTNNTAYFLNTGNKYLLAVLNSLLADFYYRQISSQLGNEAIRAFTVFTEQLPIPKIPEKSQQPFITLVDRILAITKDEDYLQNPAKQLQVKALEQEIDQLVYNLYGLHDKEIGIITANK